MMWGIECTSDADLADKLEASLWSKLCALTEIETGEDYKPDDRPIDLVDMLQLGEAIARLRGAKMRSAQAVERPSTERKP